VCAFSMEQKCDTNLNCHKIQVLLLSPFHWSTIEWSSGSSRRSFFSVRPSNTVQ
jgi:hypothetical protein